jgi:hypothetical protein
VIKRELFNRKPETVEAVQWTDSATEVIEWIKESGFSAYMSRPGCIVVARPDEEDDLYVVKGDWIFLEGKSIDHLPDSGFRRSFSKEES